MSPERTPLPLQPLVQNSAGLSRVAGLHEDNLPRDVGLIIRRYSAPDRFVLTAYGPPFPPPEPWDAEIPLTPLEVFGYVEDCRQVWQSAVVDYQEAAPNPAGGLQNRRPFQDTFDLRNRPELLRAIAPRLAVAGDKLFYLLFGAKEPNLVRVANRLREVCRQHPLTLTITSDTFFVPWGLLYVHPDPNERLAPDGANFRWEGFWGYQHVVEHNPVYIELNGDLRPNAAGRLPTSVNVDDRIDQTLNVKCIAPQLDFFKSQANIDLVERRRKDELERALSSKSFADRIVYFCCHGAGARGPDGVSLERARVTLSDGQDITNTEIKYWLRDADGLPSQPVVFINACQGGQLTTIFYETLATELLRQKAVGLVGAQVDLPAVFAAEYAERFFKRFLGGAPGERVRIGPLMRDLAQQFVRDHNNPLGLVYSLYRGADCFVQWDTPR